MSIKKTFVVFSLIVSILFGYRSSVSVAAFDCLTLTSSSAPADRQYCQNELAQIEAQLAELLIKQKAQQKNTGTLKGDVNYLNSQIKALVTKIKARSLVIAQLKASINEKNTKIETLSGQIGREYASLAQLLRNTNEFDDGTLVHIVLSDETVSNFYSDLESYSYLKESIKASVDVIRGIKTQTEVAKADLEKKRNAETDAKAELENAQKKVAVSEAEKKRLLSISKNQETEYQKIANEKKARADKIRRALFPLAGTSQKIEFGTALLYANEVNKATGVDQAFLLSVLTQESNLGANVGQCYLVDPLTGTAKGKNTGTPFVNGMKPTRDVGPFLEITAALGLDPYATAVSCPIAGVAGWGGAMGPAQFIPSTWKIFANRLKAVLGHTANPWAPRDAFMASGMYLTDLGAVGTSASAQNIAACKYYGSGGTTCAYAQSVARIKVGIQANIDLLTN